MANFNVFFSRILLYIVDQSGVDHLSVDQLSVFYFRFKILIILAFKITQLQVMSSDCFEFRNNKESQIKNQNNKESPPSVFLSHFHSKFSSIDRSFIEQNRASAAKEYKVNRHWLVKTENECLSFYPSKFVYVYTFA